MPQPRKKKKRKIKVKKKAVIKRKENNVNPDSLDRVPTVVPSNGPTFRIKLKRKK